MPSFTAAENVFNARLTRTLLLGACAVLAFFVLGWVYPVVLTVLAGLLLGVFLHGLAEPLARWSRQPYRAIMAVLVALLLTMIALSIWLIGPAVAEQLEQLGTRIPDALELLRHEAGRVPFFRWAVHATPPSGDVVKAAASVLQVSVAGVVGLVIAIVMAIYAAFDPGAYEHGLLLLVPPSKRPRAREVTHVVSHELMRWIVGRVVLMVVVGVITGLGLWIAGIPVAAALGLLAGILTFVPYLGVLLSIVPAILVALTKSPWAAVWVVVVFAIAHGLEGYVLSPLIAKRTVHFPPAFTIAVQLLLGSIWGVLGFTFATPVAVVATILVRMLYVEDALGEGPG